jgi:SAM-dependent methyltransferase
VTTEKADQADLARVYQQRFVPLQDYRRAVWQVLVDRFFQALVPPEAAILDLGCGFGEFINTIRARRKYAMDLNPNARKHLGAEVQLFEQDCSNAWPLREAELDVVFTSNFFEHLPDKTSLGRTLEEIFRCLKPGGRLIAMGPNIRFTGGRYWDFWDHYLPLTEVSLSEGLRVRGFEIERCHPQFLPYTMVGGPRYPLVLLKVYLQVPLLWRWRGQQFLVVARKPR